MWVNYCLYIHKLHIFFLFNSHLFPICITVYISVVHFYSGLSPWTMQPLQCDRYALSGFSHWSPLCLHREFWGTTFSRKYLGGLMYILHPDNWTSNVHWDIQTLGYYIAHFYSNLCTYFNFHCSIFEIFSSLYFHSSLLE